MSSSLEDIYWMCEPLFFADRTDYQQKLEGWNKKIKGRSKRASEYNKKVGNFLEPKVRDLVDPKKGSRKFPQIKHWTLEVNGWCYELSPEPGKIPSKLKMFTDACKPRSEERERWNKRRRDYDIELDRLRVGQTKMTHEEIEIESMQRVDFHSL